MRLRTAQKKHTKTHVLTFQKNNTSPVGMDEWMSRLYISCATQAHSRYAVHVLFYVHALGVFVQRCER